MKKSFSSLLMAVCVLMTFVLPVFSARAEQDVVDADEVHVSKLATIFWGIVGYTHWPNGEESLRVCLSGDDQHLTTIRQSAIELGHKTTTLFAPENAANACDVVYVSGTGMSEVDRLSRSADGAPVLTIGDGERFCSMGGMFCLLSSEEGSGEATIDRFAINEDVVSRSALRINPQVLRLSKRNREH